MKQIVKIFIAAAVALFAAEATADAQLLKNLLNKATGSTTTEQTTTSVATSNGQTAGVALKALLAQYKADGKKLDMGNINNLLNLTALANSVKDLKGQSSKGTFYKDFVKGLISGSNNLINSSNSTSVMNGITNLVNNVDLSGLTEKAESTQEKATSALSALSGKTTTAVDNATEIANSVTNILNLFK